MPDLQENQSPSFPSIERFSSLDDLNTIDHPFVRDMLQPDFSLLNQAIDSYNQAEPTHDKKLIALQAIDHARKAIEEKYPAFIFVRFPELRNHLRINLFNQMKQAASALDYHSLLDFHDQTNNKEVPFADLLANMEPQRLEQLAQILLKVPLNEAAFKALYPENDPNYPDFKAFIDNYNISCLGPAGGGNSRNFLISKPGEEASSFVLKLDGRLNQPTQHEAALRQTQHSPLTKVFAERPINAIISKSDEKEMLSSSISVGEYCAGGDLETKLKQSRVGFRLDCVLDVSIKSAELLINLERTCGYALPDGKFANLLARSDGTICLADTKSLLKVDQEGNIQVKQGENLLFKLAHSNGFLNPEFTTENSFSADKMHAYQLGKNIYQSLTGCDLNQLRDLTSSQITIEIMQQQSSLTPAKKKLLGLVARLIEENPANRPTMLEAKDQLHRIKQLYQDNKRPQLPVHTSLDPVIRVNRLACLNKLRTIENLGFGPSDTNMDNYNTNMKNRINQATNIHELSEISSLLDGMIRQQADPSLQVIRERIQYFRDKASLTTVGMRNKANNIEAAMSRIPIAQRNQIMSLNTDDAKEVKKELAEKRYWNPFIKDVRSFTLLKDVLGNGSSETKKDSTRSNH